MIKIIKAVDGGEAALVEALKGRNTGVNAKIEAEVKAIMEDVRENGWDAAVKYSLKFDGTEPYELTQEDLDTAARECSPDLYAAMEKAARNIRDYQSRLLTESKFWNVEGGALGQLVRGLTRVGIYAPGGAAAYPSSVLMCAIPAQVAGVEEMILVTPPTKNLNNAVMAAAKIAGVNRVIAIGGAHAVACLTYGAGVVPKVDKLVGPGNAYVAAAKRQAFGELDIDMVAGPSEVLIIADESANPVYCAADLLSQAEHDALAGTKASAFMVTTSQELAEAVKAELERQTALLPRQETIRNSLEGYGAIYVCDDLDMAVKIANAIAPEHLEILTKEPRLLLPKIKNAGAIFLGENSPEPLGDYMAGPSHVLPTSGTARFFSPLSAESFLKRTSVIDYSRAGLESLSRDIIRFAEAEGLYAHANSVRVRFE